jgi:hypothetical protein
MKKERPLPIDEICKYLNIDRNIFYKCIEIKELSDYYLNRLQDHKAHQILDLEYCLGLLKN